MNRLRIAIPTLNADAYLAYTLQNLLPVMDFAEVVVVDSYSTDNTLAIASSFGVSIRQCPAGNLYAAVNAGFIDSASEWLTYINADDMLYPQLLRERIQSLCENVDVSYGSVDFINRDGAFLRSWRPAPPHRLLPLYRAGYSPMLQQGTLFRNHVFQSLKGFDTAYSFVSDSDFWFRAMEAGYRFEESPYKPVAAFRLHGQQITQVKEQEMYNEHALMVSRHVRSQSKFRAMPHLFAWRLANWKNYLVRFLRASQLGASRPVCGSYDSYE